MRNAMEGVRLVLKEVSRESERIAVRVLQASREVRSARDLIEKRMKYPHAVDTERTLQGTADHLSRAEDRLCRAKYGENYLTLFANEARRGFMTGWKPPPSTALPRSADQWAWRENGDSEASVEDAGTAAAECAQCLYDLLPELAGRGDDLLAEDAYRAERAVDAYYTAIGKKPRHRRDRGG